MTILYGIKNCDTIKKARNWLEARQIPYQFHDYRQQGLDTAWLEQVAEQLDWSLLLNTRGTTFRQLADDQKAALDKDKAITLMCQYPAMIKRPLLEHHGEYHVGFKADHYEHLFNAE